MDTNLHRMRYIRLEMEQPRRNTCSHISGKEIECSGETNRLWPNE